MQLNHASNLKNDARRFSRPETVTRVNNGWHHATSGLFCAEAGLRARHKSAALIINCLAPGFVFAGVPKQFDLQTAFIKLGNQCMRGEGRHPQRRLVQLIFGLWLDAAQTSLALVVIFKQRCFKNALFLPGSILPAALVLSCAGIFKSLDDAVSGLDASHHRSRPSGH